MLWNHWWNLVCDLRSACARNRTFLWMALCLAGMTIRKDLLGVTSIVRALGLEPTFYPRLLALLHSPASDLHQLTRASGARPLLPSHRRTHPSLGQRIRLAFGLSHPRRHGLFQPRSPNPARQDDPCG